MSNGFISITHLPPTRRMPTGWRLHLSPQRPGYNLGCAGNMLTRSLLQSRNVFKNVLQKIPCSTTKAGLPSNMLTRSLLQSRNVFKNVLQKIPVLIPISFRVFTPGFNNHHLPGLWSKHWLQGCFEPDEHGFGGGR